MARRRFDAGHIKKIIQGFLSGDRCKKNQAAALYRESFDLDEIQSKSICCGTIIADSLLEFNKDNLEIFEESLSPKRMGELASGAAPRPGERKRYRTLILRHVEDGDSDADKVPVFWIHPIRDSNSDELFALTTVTGYSFSFIRTEFHGLFLSERNCIDYLKMRGIVRGVKHAQRTWKQESTDQLSLIFPTGR